MSDVDLKQKTRSKHVDRIVLEQEAITKIDQWIAQVTTHKKGLKLTRKDLLNWLIGQHAQTLSSQQEKELCQLFYDEERFLQDALKELRAAKARGEKVSFNEIQMRNQKPKGTRKTKKLPANELAQDEAPQTEDSSN